MTDTLLYIALVLIWGSTWIMVKFQLGVVPPEISVVYRYAIAAAFMFAWALARRLPLRFSARDHLLIALQGALIFSTNFYLLYQAAAILTTGLIAVIFSTASMQTVLFSALLLRRPPAPRTLFGTVLGIAGIGLVFSPELTGFAETPGAGKGLLLSLAGTASFSLGGILTARNHMAGFSVRGSTAWAMLYGALLLTIFALARGESFTFDPRFAYVGSLLFVAVIASVIGFALYFALLGRIGTERAAYATVLFPVIALAISTLYEDYRWTPTAAAGVLLILAGNVLVLRRAKLAGPGGGADPAG